MENNTVVIANKTCRSSGAVGRNAIVPRYVAQTAKPTDRILDFGAGKDAIHTKALREKGFNVTAHEFGDNQNENHDPLALHHEYDIVFASNVLNVQADGNTLYQTLKDLWIHTGIGGRLVMNYPESPRKLNVTTKQMKSIVQDALNHSIHQVGGTNRAPIWEARK